MLERNGRCGCHGNCEVNLSYCYYLLSHTWTIFQQKLMTHSARLVAGTEVFHKTASWTKGVGLES